MCSSNAPTITLDFFLPSMLSFKEPENDLVTNYNNLSTNNKPFKGSYPPQQGDKGFPAPKNDFFWETTDEPHATRRKLILQKYPQISSLLGHCPKTKYVVTMLVATQFALAYYLDDKMWTLQYWVIAYVFGATITHSLFLAIHEISHFLAFKSPNMNRLFKLTLDTLACLQTCQLESLIVSPFVDTTWNIILYKV